MLSPRAGRGEVARSRSRDAASHPSFAFTLQESPSQVLPKNEGGEAPKGASNLWPHRRQVYAVCANHPHAARAQRDALASRRSTAALARGFRPAGSTPGHASWDADPAGVTRSHLSQSRDCTSLTGRNAGVTDAQSRPGAGRNPARGHRSRSTFESTLAKGPSVNGMERHVTISVTNVNGKVRPFPEPSLPDLIRQSMRRLGMDHRVIGERKRRRPSNGYARW